MEFRLKMNSQQVLALAIVFLASIAHAQEQSENSTTSGISCYVCNERQEPNCGNLINADGFIKECQANATYCRKIVQEGKHEAD